MFSDHAYKRLRERADCLNCTKKQFARILKSSKVLLENKNYKYLSHNGIKIVCRKIKNKLFVSTILGKDMKIIDKNA